MAKEVSLTKGGITVTIETESVVSDYSNKIFVITPAQTVGGQENGPRPIRIVDLLRVNHQVVIKGHLTSDADKLKLVNIFRGAGENGGEITLSFDGILGLDGSSDSITGYLEKCVITEDQASKDPTTTHTDQAKYPVALTFVEGNRV